MVLRMVNSHLPDRSHAIEELHVELEEVVALFQQARVKGMMCAWALDANVVLWREAGDSVDTGGQSVRRANMVQRVMEGAELWCPQMERCPGPTWKGTSSAVPRRYDYMAVDRRWQSRLQAAWMCEPAYVTDHVPVSARIRAVRSVRKRGARSIQESQVVEDVEAEE